MNGIGGVLRMLRLYLRIERLRRRVQRDPMRRSYSDLAITPVGAADADTLELYQTADAARQTMVRARERGKTPGGTEHNLGPEPGVTRQNPICL